MHRSLLVLPLLALLTACPTVKLGTVAVSDTAPKKGTFTLAMDVVVEETDPTDGENGQPASGRGVMGLHLPDGWSVVAARMKSPTEPVMRRLYPSPQSAGVFADTFPTVEDPWWAFSSPEQTIQQGKHTYRAEYDILVGGKAKAGDIGLLMTILQDDMTDLPAPSEFSVAMKGKKAVLKSKGTGAAATPGQGAKGDKVPAGK